MIWIKIYSISQIILSPVSSLVLFTPFIILTIPLSPSLQIIISLLSLPEVQVTSESLCIPNRHVTGHLNSIHFHHQSTKPIRNPSAGVTIVVDHLSKFTLWQQVMEQDSCEKWALQKYEHRATTQLNYCDIHKKLVTYKWYLHKIVDVANTHEPFFGVILNEEFIDFLFIVSNVFILMFEHRFYVRTVPSHPTRFPSKVYRIIIFDNLSMHKFKV